MSGEFDVREPRGEKGTDGEKGGFAHLHVAEEPGAGGGVERGDDEAEEGDAGQGHEQGLAEPRGYQGGGGKEAEVDSGAGEHVDPEDGIEVGRSGFFLAVERTDEPALLQCRGDEGEDGEHADESVVGRGEATGQEDAERKVQHLLCAIHDAAPKQSVRRLLFKGLF